MPCVALPLPAALPILRRVGRHYPFRLLIAGAVFAAVAGASLFIATIPGERLDRADLIAAARQPNSSASLLGQALPVLTLAFRSEEHTSELQSLRHLVCRASLFPYPPLFRSCGASAATIPSGCSSPGQSSPRSPAHRCSSPPSRASGSIAPISLPRRASQTAAHRSWARPCRS